MSRVVACFALVAVATALVAGAGKSEIADAAQRGDRAAVQKLILQKVDVNAPQVDGATALHWAVYRQDTELADVLIRAGANVKADESHQRDAAGDGVAVRQRGTHRPADQGRR